MKRVLALLLALGLLLTGCAGKASYSEDLMKEVNPSQEEVTPSQKVEPMNTDIGGEGPAWEDAQVSDFAVRLLQATMEDGKNTLISPYSVLCALAMTANGADGNTLTQMEEVLGQSVDALNNWYKYGTTQDDFLHLANGIWFKDDPNFAVEEDFLQTNADYYGAGIYKAPFDDSTLKDINRFVEENTGGMVKDILNEIPEDAVMYLVNALGFDAKWQEVYKENQVHADIFTTEGGTEQDIELMYSEEYQYLEDDYATGFLKFYEGRKYAFAALLPNEGVTVADYVQSLTGAHLQEMLANPQNVTVNAAIPKFETEFDTQMSEVLSAMGMSDAFDFSAADFTRLGSHTDGNIYISRVLHKTFISVAEQGTKAGAATVVEMIAESAMEIEDLKTVTLDRPFVYMILDMESNTPIFMGTMMNNGEEDFLFVEPNAYSHTHIPAEEPALCADPVEGYCGNTQTTVYLDGEEYTFMGTDSVTLTDILINLDYDPDAVCRCATNFTVDTEFETGFGVNLGEAFTRCERGQAPLTAEQIQTIRDIIERLEA